MIRAAAGPSGRRPRTRAEPAGDGRLPRVTSLAEPVTRRQPQAWAGQVVRADRTAPDAPPRRPLTRAGRRNLIAFPRCGIISAVQGGLRGHGDDLLPMTSVAPARSTRRLSVPPRNSASTSVRRYRGRPTSSRTSGSRPRRAQVATAAEVTRNTAATCLRVISSSSMWPPVSAAAVKPVAAGRGTTAARPCRCRCHHVHRSPLVSRNELARDSAGHLARLLPGARPGHETAPPSADCTDNADANCRARHRSADRYSTTAPPLPAHRELRPDAAPEPPAAASGPNHRA